MTKNDNNFNDWYNGNELITKGRLYNFLIGQRGGGKTFFWKKRVIENFLKNGKQFMWLRRYQTELLEMKDWANALKSKGYFKDIEFECSKKYIKINGKIAGYVGSLSRSQHIKSIEYPNVTSIVYDEFLITGGTLKYMKDECKVLVDIVETVFRDRDKGNIVVCIGNAVSVVNPFFNALKLEPNIYKRYSLFDDECIELYNNPKYAEMKKNTRQGRVAMKLDGYGEYMYENKFLNDKDSFIKKRPKALVYSCTIVYKNVSYGVWNDFKDGTFYIDKIIEKDCQSVVVVDINDLNRSGRLMTWKGYNMLIEILSTSMSEGKVWFDNIVTKTNMYQVFKLV